jgi:hypothetical protein
MKTATLLSAALAVSFQMFEITANAQTATEETSLAVDKANYRTAFGLRAGETSGLTFKHFFSNNSAFEGIFSAWPYALGITALYEKHEQAFEVEGLNWYFGGGGHVAFETARSYYWYRYDDRYVYYHNRSGLGLGIDGIVGLEYKIKPIPFAFSLDLKPFAEVNRDGVWFMALDPGLGVKVTF